MSGEPDYICGVTCEQAFHWKWIAHRQLKTLSTDKVAFVTRGQVIRWNGKPEMVTEGNRRVGGWFETRDRQGRKRRRAFKDFIVIYPRLHTGRNQCK